MCLLHHRGIAFALPQGHPFPALGLAAEVGGAAILWRKAPQALLSTHGVTLLEVDLGFTVFM